MSSHDQDNDGVPLWDEILQGTDPEEADSDGDGLHDGEEAALGTDPLDPDTDADGMSDGDEVRLGTNPLTRDTTAQAFKLASDEDRDGLLGYEEMSIGTDPRNPDTDGDGLRDGAEARKHGTDPLRADTDSDGVDDGVEIRRGTDPTGRDSDMDGLTDDQEAELGTDPHDRDTDDDGLTDWEEAELYGTDPTVADTDHDGVEDAIEVMFSDATGMDPTNPDTDGDGILDGEEYLYGTRADDADTDDDGIDDGTEVAMGNDPGQTDDYSDYFAMKEHERASTQQRSDDVRELNTSAVRADQMTASGEISSELDMPEVEGFGQDPRGGGALEDFGVAATEGRDLPGAELGPSDTPDLGGLADRGEPHLKGEPPGVGEDQGDDDLDDQLGSSRGPDIGSDLAGRPHDEDEAPERLTIHVDEREASFRTTVGRIWAAVTGGPSGDSSSGNAVTGVRGTPDPEDGGPSTPQSEEAERWAEGLVRDRESTNKKDTLVNPGGEESGTTEPRQFEPDSMGERLNPYILHDGEDDSVVGSKVVDPSEVDVVDTLGGDSRIDDPAGGMGPLGGEAPGQSDPYEDDLVGGEGEFMDG